MFFWLLGTSIIFTVLAQLLLKKGVLALGEITWSLKGLGSFIVKFFQNGYLVGGLTFFGLAFFFWILTLSKIKLSIAYPISTALNLSLVTLFSCFIFRENLSAIQIVGIFVIMVGIFLLLWKY
ncbi:MAG: SMR family transporter [Candidatus Gribaldobacteria bacterium]|nr:SMR family transporter [Candidatus Gribaldobacteria bacterium]